MSQNRNRNRGGGGGGGGDNITIQARISGGRSNCKVGVVLRKGKLALPNETLMFRFGTADAPQGPWLTDPTDPDHRYILTTHNEGEGETIGFDLSGDAFKSFTQLLVVYHRNNDPAQGIHEQAVQLPVLETTDGPKATKTDKHAYHVEADLDSPHPVGDKFIVVGTVTSGGKPVSCICVISSAPENVTVEARSGKVEPGTDPNTYNVTSSAAGKFKLAVPANFSSRYLELEITAPDGASATVPMVKPR